MMKKMICGILAVMMALTLALGGLADERPEPEGGRKFATNWAIFGMTVRIHYEEEGYRVAIEAYSPEELRGTVWQYACCYKEDKDVLESVSSSKYSYSRDPETLEEKAEAPEYEGLDTEKCSVFAIDENGMLTWEDGRGQDGADLCFADIGRFDGGWRDDAAGIWAEITWSDDENDYGYHVFLHRDREDGFTEEVLTGLYDGAAGKLTCSGTQQLNSRNDEGGYDDPVELGEVTEVFHFDQAGRLVLEGGTDVALTYYDPMMENNG